MNKSTRIIIVDDSEFVCNSLKSALESRDCFEIVTTISNPVNAIPEILSKRPDILLLDIAMPSIDGEEILERLGQILDYNLGVIVISSMNSDCTIRRCMNLGAHFFMVKPIDTNILAKKIHQVISDIPQTLNKNWSLPDSGHKNVSPADELNTRITKYLFSLGFTAKLKGFYYLRDCMFYIINSENELFSVTKIIYPYIAEIYETGPERVERAIRSAIVKTFANEECRKHYCATVDPMFCRKTIKGNPSNREFIFSSAEYIRNSLPESFSLSVS